MEKKKLFNKIQASRKLVIFYKYKTARSLSMSV